MKVQILVAIMLKKKNQGPWSGSPFRSPFFYTSDCLLQAIGKVYRYACAHLCVKAAEWQSQKNQQIQKCIFIDILKTEHLCKGLAICCAWNNGYSTVFEDHSISKKTINALAFACIVARADLSHAFAGCVGACGSLACICRFCACVWISRMYLWILWASLDL